MTVEKRRGRREGEGGRVRREREGKRDARSEARRLVVALLADERLDLPNAPLARGRVGLALARGGVDAEEDHAPLLALEVAPDVADVLRDALGAALLGRDGAIARLEAERLVERLLRGRDEAERELALCRAQERLALRVILLERLRRETVLEGGAEQLEEHARRGAVQVVRRLGRVEVDGVRVVAHGRRVVGALVVDVAELLLLGGARDALGVGEVAVGLDRRARVVVVRVVVVRVRVRVVVRVAGAVPVAVLEVRVVRVGERGGRARGRGEREVARRREVARGRGAVAVSASLTSSAGRTECEVSLELWCVVLGRVLWSCAAQGEGRSDGHFGAVLPLRGRPCPSRCRVELDTP